MPEHKKARVAFALEYALDFKHLMEDERSLKALEVCQAYIDGRATEEDLAEAARAARDAYYAVYWDLDDSTTAHLAVCAATSVIRDSAAYAVWFAVYTHTDVYFTDPIPQITLDRLEKHFHVAAVKEFVGDTE